MLIGYSKNRTPIRLTDERWGHIVTWHPELDGQRRAVLETVAGPEIIQQGDYGELLAAWFYKGTSLGDKYLVAAYLEVKATDGFILTAYYTRRLSTQREILWKR